MVQIVSLTNEAKVENTKTVTWNDCGYSCTFEYFGSFTSGGRKYHVISGDNMQPKKNVSDKMFNEYYTING